VRINHVFNVVVEGELVYRSGRCYWHGPCGLGFYDWFWEGKLLIIFCWCKA
jgi:hypothetical protein